MPRLLNKELDQCWNQLPLAEVKSLKISSITDFGNSVNDCDEDEENSPNTFSDNTLRNLIDAYNNARSSKSRKEILSIFAQKFKRKQLKDLIPGLTDFRIKEARKHCKDLRISAPSLRDSAQYGIYFLPTSRQYNVVLPSQNRN